MKSQNGPAVATAQLVRDAGATIARMGLIAADERADALFTDLLKKYSAKTKARRITTKYKTDMEWIR